MRSLLYHPTAQQPSGGTEIRQLLHRESADCYLEAVLVCVAAGHGQSGGGDKWMGINSAAPSARYHSFHGYTSILQEKYFVPCKKDFTSLTDLFLYSETEPIIFRCEAGFTLGLISWYKGDREEAADFYRDVISLGNQVTREEKERRYVGVDPNCMVAPGSYFIRKVEDGIKDIVKLARDNLDNLQSRNKVSLEDLLVSLSRSDGTSYHERVFRTCRFKVY
jgi:hypothetical protein